MPDRKKFELQQQKRPCLIPGELKVERSKSFEIPGNACRSSEKLFHPSPITKRTLFNEREKDVLLALELRVDCSLGAAGKGRNLSQFCPLVSVSYEDRFSGLEQKRPGFSCSKFVFVGC